MRLLTGFLALFVSLVVAVNANAAYQLTDSVNISDQPTPPKGSVEVLVTMDGIHLLVLANKHYNSNRYTTDYLAMNLDVVKELQALPITEGLAPGEYDHFTCRGTVFNNQIFELSDCVSTPL